MNLIRIRQRVRLELLESARASCRAIMACSLRVETGWLYRWGELDEAAFAWPIALQSTRLVCLNKTLFLR